MKMSKKSLAVMLAASTFDSFVQALKQGGFTVTSKGRDYIVKMANPVAYSPMLETIVQDMGISLRYDSGKKAYDIYSGRQGIAILKDAGKGTGILKRVGGGSDIVKPVLWVQALFVKEGVEEVPMKGLGKIKKYFLQSQFHNAKLSKFEISSPKPHLLYVLVAFDPTGGVEPPFPFKNEDKKRIQKFLSAPLQGLKLKWLNLGAKLEYLPTKALQK